MMQKVLALVLKLTGLLVYVGLIAMAVVRFVTGEGDVMTPILGIILLSGFSALFSLVLNLTDAVKALVSATNEEISLLVNMSQLNALSGTVQQKDYLN